MECKLKMVDIGYLRCDYYKGPFLTSRETFFRALDIVDPQEERMDIRRDSSWIVRASVTNRSLLKERVEGVYEGIPIGEENGQGLVKCTMHERGSTRSVVGIFDMRDYTEKKFVIATEDFIPEAEVAIN